MDFFRLRQTEFIIDFNRCHMKKIHVKIIHIRKIYGSIYTTVHNYIMFLYIKYYEPSKINNRCRIHIAIYQY